MRYMIVVFFLDAYLISQSFPTINHARDAARNYTVRDKGYKVFVCEVLDEVTF